MLLLLPSAAAHGPRSCPCGGMGQEMLLPLVLRRSGKAKAWGGRKRGGGDAVAHSFSTADDLGNSACGGRKASSTT